MKNILNLLKLQYNSIYAIKKYFIIIMVLAVVMPFFDNAFIPFASAIIIMGTTYSTAAYEDRSKMNYLIYSLPIKPKEFILSKYIYGFLNVILAMGFNSIFFVISKTVLKADFTNTTLISFNISTIIIGFIITTIVIPIALVVGFEKGRIILVLLAVVPICCSPILANFLPKVELSIYSKVSEILIVLVSIIFTIVSYAITSNLYMKRDIN